MERELYHSSCLSRTLALLGSEPPLPAFPGNIRPSSASIQIPQDSGVRPYKPGIPKTVHWKATGRTGALQVKQYEHTITLNVMILLNMDEPDYDVHSWYSDKELAVQAAAQWPTMQHRVEKRADLPPMPATKSGVLGTAASLTHSLAKQGRL